jgi:hypothetical protein
LVPRKRLTQSLANFHVDRAAVGVIKVLHGEARSVISCRTKLRRRLLFSSGREDGGIKTEPFPPPNWLSAPYRADNLAAAGHRKWGPVVVRISWNRYGIQTTF